MTTGGQGQELRRFAGVLYTVLCRVPPSAAARGNLIDTAEYPRL